MSAAVADSRIVDAWSRASLAFRDRNPAELLEHVLLEGVVRYLLGLRHQLSLSSSAGSRAHAFYIVRP